MYEETPVVVLEFSQHEKFDCNLRCTSPINAWFSADYYFF